MLHIHPNARTTPATRAAIARSSEPSSTVAQHYGISAETVRKWRKRGASDCLDHSARSCRVRPKAAVSSCSSSSWMNPCTLSRMAPSIGSNQASPANSFVRSASIFVLFCSMAWSPPVLKRRIGSSNKPETTSPTYFHHIRDGTQNHWPARCTTIRLEG